MNGTPSPAPRCFHPWLFAVAPTALLYAGNSSHVTLHHAVLPVVASLSATLVLYAASRSARFPPASAALLASALHIAFWSRGHLTNAMHGWVAEDATRASTGLLSLLLLGALAVRLRRRQPSSQTTRVANVLAGALVAIPLAQVARHVFQPTEVHRPANLEALIPPSTTGRRMPDVFCILLDAYGSPQILRTRYGLDVAPFTTALRDRGFLVNEGVFSNYALTEFSLASLLNAENLDELLGSHVGGEQDRTPIRAAIRDGRILAAFRAAGYRIVTFPSGYPDAEVPDADEVHQPFLAPSEFHSLVYTTTALPEVLDLAGLEGSGLLYDLHRARLMHTLKGFPNIAGRKTPSFVLAHALVPHPPFVIDGRGEPTRTPWPFTFWDGQGLLELYPQVREAYVSGYRNQVQGTNRILLASLDRLLAATGGDVVILIFGDHGPRLGTVSGSPDRTDLQEAFSVFLAAYWPSQDYSDLRRVRTLVNVFPAVLNGAFGTRIPFREDRIFFSSSEKPYGFSNVTATLLPLAPP